MSRLTSWRLALRLARREALRARGRSILVLVMIALPVLAVTAADVVIRTQDVNSVEGLDRRLGSAAAEVSVPYDGTRALQGPDPDARSMPVGRRQAVPTEARLAAALGGARLLPKRDGEVNLVTEHGVGYAEATEVDLTDPLTDGLFRLTAGRWPRTADEVVVNQAALDKGYELGNALDLKGKGAASPTIVGVAESTSVRSWPVVAGPPGSLGLASGRRAAAPQWLVDGGPVPWSTVRNLNALGAVVLSRAVVEHPPPESAVPAPIRGWDGGTDNGLVAAVVLVVVMALLEVVLLAGPAFAVSARRLARSLALMAVAGGTPAQSRRVVVAGGVVLGGAAALLGVVLGIGAGRLLVPIVQLRAGSWFGPFEVPWLHLLGIAAFGLVSAVLAAVVPAWIASRQDVVAVLAGRRADRAPSLRSPALGVVLLGAGIAGSAYGARAGSNGPYLIAGSAVVAVLGMIFLAPVVVVGVARLSSRLPLSARYAARDAARHRTRTVPAVAAVAATVAGVVALGIAVTSDEAENEATYTPELPIGVGAVTSYGRSPDWEALRAAVERGAPGSTVAPVTGVVEDLGRHGYLDLGFRTAEGRVPLDSYGGVIGSSALVDDGSGVSAFPGLPAGDLGAAARTLARGGAVVVTDQGDTREAEVRISATAMSPRGKASSPRRARTPALIVRVERNAAGPQAVLSPKVARRLGLRTAISGLLVSGTELTPQEATSVGEAVGAVSPRAGFYVERGYQANDETVIVQLVLAGLGAVLMLGGTLTATFLALSDARPDLATLSAVGASPRRRRAIAASYALVVGLVGAVLGAAVGFVPGIAVTYPLTNSDAGPFLDVPWLLVLGVVLGLPLLTAGLVALTARSRLPLVARVD